MQEVELRFWGEVNEDSGLEFLNDLDVATAAGAKSVLIRINSYGGDVASGFAIYNALKELKAKGVTVYTLVEGVAASMGSIIALAGEKVQMAENAEMMIHQPWTVAAGNATELESRAEELRKMEPQFVSIYTQKTGLSEQKVKNLLENETWLTAKEALTMGFIDEIRPTTLALSAKVPEKISAERLYALYQTPKANNNTMNDQELKAQIDALKAENAELKAKIEAQESAAKAAKAETEADALVSEGVKENKLNEQAKASFKAVALKDIEGAKALLATLPAIAGVSAAAQVRATKAGGKIDVQGKSFRELEKSNPALLAQLKTQNIEQYKELFKAQYGAEPK